MLIGRILQVLYLNLKNYLAYNYISKALSYLLKVLVLWLCILLLRLLYCG